MKNQNECVCVCACMYLCGCPLFLNKNLEVFLKLKSVLKQDEKEKTKVIDTTCRDYVCKVI